MKLPGCVCSAEDGWGVQQKVPNSMTCPLILPDYPKARPAFAHGVPNQHLYWLIPKYEWTIKTHQTFEESLKDEGDSIKETGNRVFKTEDACGSEHPPWWVSQQESRLRTQLLFNVCSVALKFPIFCTFDEYSIVYVPGALESLTNIIKEIQ